MSKIEKLKERLLRRPKDLTFDELRTLLCALGYKEVKTGRTAGSRVTFWNQRIGHTIHFHKPHPSSVMKSYYIKKIADEFIKRGILP
jgi:hypothetical protein